MLGENKVIAIILAAGSGKRMNLKYNKAFIELDNKPILTHSISVFEKCDLIDEIIVIGKESELDKIKKDIIDKYELSKVVNLISGGNERQDSVFNGIKNIDCELDDTIVVIHDGARPFLDVDVLEKSIEKTLTSDGCIVGVPSKDTIKVIENNVVKKTLDRNRLINVQTPQCFKLKIIKKAYEMGKKMGVKATDDSQLVENIGYKVEVVIGSYDNIKITTKEDLIIGEQILEKRKLEK